MKATGKEKTIYRLSSKLMLDNQHKIYLANLQKRIIEAPEIDEATFKKQMAWIERHNNLKSSDFILITKNETIKQLSKQI